MTMYFQLLPPPTLCKLAMIMDRGATYTGACHARAAGMNSYSEQPTRAVALPSLTFAMSLEKRKHARPPRSTGGYIAHRRSPPFKRESLGEGKESTMKKKQGGESMRREGIGVTYGHARTASLAHMKEILRLALMMSGQKDARRQALPHSGSGMMQKNRGCHPYNPCRAGKRLTPPLSSLTKKKMKKTGEPHRRRRRHADRRTGTTSGGSRRPELTGLG